MNRLSDSEFTIMQEIWSRSGPVTAGGLVEAFSERRCWKIQTVSTFLTRLVDKGMLTCEKHGGQNLYRVAVSEADYRAGETRDFLREVHGGSVQSFFAALGSPGSLSGAGDRGAAPLARRGGDKMTAFFFPASFPFR